MEHCWASDAKVGPRINRKGNDKKGVELRRRSLAMMKLRNREVTMLPGIGRDPDGGRVLSERGKWGFGRGNEGTACGQSWSKQQRLS